MSGTLEQQLQEILDIKEDMAQAITSKGIETQVNETLSSYVDKIINLQGQDVPTNSFSLFDTKVTDRILTGASAKGWAEQGTSVFRSEYPQFFAKCVNEYENGKDTSIYAYSHHQPTSGIKDDKGILSGFTATQYSLVPGIPQNVQSYEIAARFRVHSLGDAQQGVIANSNNNKRTPQIVITKAGALACDHPIAKDTWAGISPYVNIQINIWYDVKMIWDGSVVKLFCRAVGEQEWIQADKDIPTTTCSWLEQLALGADNIGSGFPIQGEIDLNGCYVDINGERWWNGTTRLPIKQCDNQHKYYHIDHKPIVDKMFNTFKQADVYGICPELEYVCLPKMTHFADNEGFKKTYYCVASSVTEDAIVDITNEVQLNNPFYLGMSHYFENEPNNLSWLKSDGCLQSSDMYPSMYEWILANYTNNVKDFHSIQDNYTDYSFVIDTENRTFRLPILNGEENLPGTNYETIVFPADTSYKITKPVNGFYCLDCRVAHAGIGVVINDKISKTVSRCNCPGEDCLCDCTLFVPANHETTLYKAYLSTNKATDKCYFIPAIGNGSLYYYVGDSVQNAHLIDAAKIQQSILNLKESLPTITDGIWNGTSFVLESATSVPTVNNWDDVRSYDLSTYLPQDDHEYEILLQVHLTTAKTAGSWADVRVYNPNGTDDYSILRITSPSAYALQGTSTGTAVVQPNKGFKVIYRSSGTSTVSVCIKGYRRLGKLC